METYTLVALVALFIGMMTVVAMLDRRRRTEQVHFDQLHQTFVSCLDALRKLHTGNEAQSARLAEALNELRASGERRADVAAELSRALLKDSTRAVEQASVHVSGVVLQHQKALDATLARAADRLSESSAAQTKELLAEAQRTTKAVETLRTSLEESVKF